MAEGDWLDLRGWVETLSFTIADNTVGMSRFWRQKWTTADILTEFIMAVVGVGVIMTTLLMLLWIERKFFARIMDRRGATTALRSCGSAKGENTPIGTACCRSAPAGRSSGWWVS